MLSFEEAQKILTDIADRLPEAIFRDLNGGIILLPDVKLHPQGIGDNLYIMGQYHSQPFGMGRYITIYYGSFAHVYGHLHNDRLAEKLKEVLYHELTHHLEHKAGEKGLEIQDEMAMENYRRRMGVYRLRNNHNKE